jgi:FixJ family two-component response regulator
MPSTPRTIVIVDDDESVRKALCRLLRSVGNNVQGFATAEEFLQGSLQPEPDCLVLDVHLPGLSGLELQERLNAGNRRIPVVFITAYEDEAACQLAMQQGAMAFLHKPFEERSLLEAIGKALS